MSSNSPRKSRRVRKPKSAAATLMSQLMSEDRLVKFKFEDETHTRSLPWNVLLTTDESVFLSYEDVEVGSQVLAPWTDGSTKKVQYAKAVIVGDDDWSEDEFTESGEMTTQLKKSNPVKGDGVSPSKGKAESSTPSSSSKRKAKSSTPSKRKAKSCTPSKRKAKSSTPSKRKAKSSTPSKRKAKSSTPSSPSEGKAKSSTPSSPSEGKAKSSTPSSPSKRKAKSSTPSKANTKNRTGKRKTRATETPVAPKPKKVRVTSTLQCSRNLLTQLTEQDSELSQSHPIGETVEVDSLITLDSDSYEISPSSKRSLQEDDCDTSTNPVNSPEVVVTPESHFHLDGAKQVPIFLTPNSSSHDPSHKEPGTGTSEWGSSPFSFVSGSTNDPNSPYQQHIQPSLSRSSSFPSTFSSPYQTTAPHFKEPPPPQSSHFDPNYMFRVWIAPLQQQIQSLESKLLAYTERTSKPDSKVMATSEGQSGVPSSVMESVETAETALLQDECDNGVYLGFRKRGDSNKVWVPMSAAELQKIEASVDNTAASLAKGLFEFLFKDELQRRPNQICATANRLDGRELCDPQRMRAIRLHVAKKHKCSKEEEPKRWKDITKKLNSHIRYCRSRFNKAT